MSFNKIIIVGNVGTDPEITNFDNGGKAARFRLATSERAFTTRDGKQIPERTHWHNIRLSNGLASVAEQWVMKGSKLLIEGKIRTRSYTDKNNETRYVTEIIAENMRMLGGGNRSGSDQNTTANTPRTPAPDEPGYSASNSDGEDGFPF